MADGGGARRGRRRAGVGTGSPRHATVRDMGAIPAAQLEKACVSAQERPPGERDAGA